jgi:hypothetical protein
MLINFNYIRALSPLRAKSFSSGKLQTCRHEFAAEAGVTMGNSGESPAR